MASSPLEVISLQEVKSLLEIDFPDHDMDISEIIKASIEWIERYTSYRLWVREEVEYATSCQMEIYTFPINSIEVKNDKGDDVRYKSTKRTLKLLITAPEGSEITMNVGFEDLEEVPSMLTQACKKLAVYIFENRDAYPMTLPSDIQGMVNQFRRSMF